MNTPLFRSEMREWYKSTMTTGTHRWLEDTLVVEEVAYQVIRNDIIRSCDRLSGAKVWGVAIVSRFVLAIFSFLSLYQSRASRWKSRDRDYEDEHRLAEMRVVLLDIGTNNRRSGCNKNHVSFRSIRSASLFSLTINLENNHFCCMKYRYCDTFMIRKLRFLCFIRTRSYYVIKTC